MCLSALLEVTEIGPHILSNIVTLLVDGNTLASGALCELPCANLGRLATLGASSNPDLAELPDELGLCASLASCNLSDTAVTELPTSITALKKVKVLQMDNCPISDPKVKKKLVDARDGGKALKELWKLIEKQGGSLKDSFLEEEGRNTTGQWNDTCGVLMNDGSNTLEFGCGDGGKNVAPPKRKTSKSKGRIKTCV